jgi:hypothetical protein
LAYCSGAVITSIEIVRNSKDPSKATKRPADAAWRRIVRLAKPSHQNDDGFRRPSKFAFAQLLLFIAVGFVVAVSVIQLIEAAFRQ